MICLVFFTSHIILIVSIINIFFYELKWKFAWKKSKNVGMPSEKFLYVHR